MRRIAYANRPPELEMLGLHAALNSMSRRVSQQSGFSIDLKTQNASVLKRLNEQTSTALFRICQEALTNSIRHSGGTKVEIELCCNDDLIILQIEDNGLFDEKTMSWGGGLSNLHGRVKKLGGQFRIFRSNQGSFAMEVQLPHTHEIKRSSMEDTAQ